MAALLLEDPLVLLCALVVAWIALFIAWRHWQTRATGWAFAVAVLGGGLLLAVNLLVETDREVARQVLARVVRDVEAGRLAAVLPAIAPTYRDASGVTYERVQRSLNGWLGKVPVSAVRLSDWHAERDAQGRLTVQFTARGMATLAGLTRPFGPDRWQLQLTPQNGRWLITDIQLLGGGLTGVPQIRTLSDLLQYDVPM